MIRYLCTVLVGLACLSPAALAAAPRAQQGSSAPLATPSPGGATAALQDCHVALAQTERSVTFSGEMSTLPGARRMAIRVVLLERSTGAGLHGVTAPGLGVWRRSALDVQVYRYVKQVVNLPAPAAFEGVIDFRWLDAHGHVIRQVRHRTPACQQPDQRPLLRVGHVTLAPAEGSADATYAITVRNDGRGPADGFVLVLSVNSVQQPPITVPGVPPFSRLEVDTTAPTCSAGSTIAVTPDPSHQLDEAPGGGLPRSFPCP